MKIYPPFGKYLDTEKHSYSAAIIFLGPNSWAIASEFQNKAPSIRCAMFLPFKKSPKDYFWPVKGLDVYICDTDVTDLNFVKYFSTVLFGFGANAVMYNSAIYNCSYEKGISI